MKKLPKPKKRVDPDFRDQLKNRATTFTDRKKENSRSICRKKVTHEES